MVQALVNLTDYTNRVLNVVKAQHGFKRRDDALNFVVGAYGEDALEPALRPQFVKKSLETQKEKAIFVGSPAALRKRYGV